MTRRLLNLLTALSLLLCVAVVALCVPIAGCQRSMQRPYPGGLGVPDLIEDSDVDVSRYYLPSRPPEERWPLSALVHRTYYYLAERRRVVLRPGKREVHLPLDEQTAQLVERTLDDLRTWRK